uniref:Candidate secreted effector n=1 Tax=Meloidogyne incognita TaxID=6306 RepID=A0A914MPW9_MELIC
MQALAIVIASLSTSNPFETSKNSRRKATRAAIRISTSLVQYDAKDSSRLKGSSLCCSYHLSNCALFSGIIPSASLSFCACTW